MPIVTKTLDFGSIDHNKDLLEKPITSPKTFKDIYSSGSSHFDKFLRRDPERFNQDGFSTEEIPIESPKATSDLYVNTTGDTMTGFLTLNDNPVEGLHAVTKQYADAVISSNDLWSRDPSINILSPQTVGDGVKVSVPTARREALVLQTTDDNTTKSLVEMQDSSGGVMNKLSVKGIMDRETRYIFMMT